MLTALRRAGVGQAIISSHLPRAKRRVMSTSSTKLHKFYVYAPDREEPGTMARRLEVRPRHLEAIAPLVESGIIQVGGMIVTPDSIVGDCTRKAVASMLIVKAKSLGEATELIKSDVYYTSNVWNSEKIVILPFLPATPFPA